MAKKSFSVVAGMFLGRMVFKVFIGFLGVACKASVLCLPVRVILNEIAPYFGLETVSLGFAWKLIALLNFLFTPVFKESKSEKEE